MRLLLVEDNPGDARLLREIIDEYGQGKHELQHVETLSGAARRVVETEFHVILLDLSLPDSQGLDTLTALNDAAKDLTIVILTGLDDEETAIEAVRMGAQDYLIKGQTNGPLLMRALQYAVERERLRKDLQEALATVKRLSGLLPICANCKKIRDDSGYWTQVEQYIEERTDASFTHGLCPDCVRDLFPEYAEDEERAGLP